MSRTATNTERGPTRQRLLEAAARLFSERGFHGVTIDELGAVAGVRGPAIYKHFPNKAAVLGALLSDVSDGLLSGGRAVIESTPEPGQALERLVRFHAAFALEQPDVIRVQDRDLSNLPPTDQHHVRIVQRAYVQRWVDVLVALRPDLDRAEAQLRVQAAFGLLNSTPHSTRRGAERERALRVLVAMALAGLQA